MLAREQALGALPVYDEHGDVCGSIGTDARIRDLRGRFVYGEEVNWPLRWACERIVELRLARAEARDA
jgi:hypothetical protein